MGVSNSVLLVKHQPHPFLPLIDGTGPYRPRLVLLDYIMGPNLDLQSL